VAKPAAVTPQSSGLEGRARHAEDCIATAWTRVEEAEGDDGGGVSAAVVALLLLLLGRLMWEMMGRLD
jgi:hypothetical protein